MILSRCKENHYFTCTHFFSNHVRDHLLVANVNFLLRGQVSWASAIKSMVHLFLASSKTIFGVFFRHDREAAGVDGADSGDGDSTDGAVPEVGSMHAAAAEHVPAIEHPLVVRIVCTDGADNRRQVTKVSWHGLFCCRWVGIWK